MSSSAAKTSFILVQFKYGDSLNPTFFRLTNANERLPTTKGTFESDPKLAIGKVSITGSLEEPHRQIDFASNLLGFGMAITSGIAFPLVEVDVWEYQVDLNGATYYEVFVGEVLRAQRNAKGKVGLYSVRVIGEKALLSGIRYGVPALELCDNTFGDVDTCKFDLDAVTETGTGTAIDKQTITVTGLVAQAEGYWVNGSITYDGLSLKILNWSEGSDDFLLSAIPPESWGLSTPLVVKPGCDNTYAACSKWQNTNNFLGLGIRMPDYHPVMENPRGT